MCRYRLLWEITRIITRHHSEGKPWLSGKQGQREPFFDSPCANRPADAIPS